MHVKYAHYTHYTHMHTDTHTETHGHQHTWTHTHTGTHTQTHTHAHTPTHYTDSLFGRCLLVLPVMVTLDSRTTENIIYTVVCLSKCACLVR